MSSKPVTGAPHARGTDLTEGPIARTLILFALPTLASSILQSLNGSINAIWIGRLLGQNALAATSNANVIMFLMFAGVFGFGMAATITVGQSMGRRDIDGVRRVVGTALGLFLIISLTIAVLGWLAAPWILHQLATPAEAQPLAVAYLRVIFLSMPSSFVATLLMMALRGSGDALTPLWFMVLGAIIDVVLNPLLIAGFGPFPALGIAGSAWATLIASYVGLAGLVTYIMARDLPIRLRGAEWRYVRPDPGIVRLLLAKGLPMGIQMIVLSLSGMISMGLVNRYGVTITAAYGVTLQIWTYIQMPAVALAAAISAMVAQNIGAGHWGRVDRIARTGVIVAVTMTLALILLTIVADRAVLALFLGDNARAIELAAQIHWIGAWPFLPFAATISLAAVVRANGAAIPPLVIIFISAFPVRLGFIFAALPWLGVGAVWWSFWANGAASLAMMLAYFRWGRWREGKLMAPVEAAEARDLASPA